MSPPPRPAELPFADVPDPLAASEGPVAPAEPLPKSRPTRVDRRLRARLAMAVSLAWFALNLGWFGVRGDLSHVGASSLVVLVIAPLPFALLGLGVAGAAGRLGLGPRASVVVAVTLLPLFVLLLAVPLLGPATPGGPLGTPAETLLCFGVTLGFAIVPVLAAAFALGRSFVASARWRSALLGSAAGLASAALINLHCDRVGVAHVVLGHLAAAVAITLIAAVLLSRATRS